MKPTLRLSVSLFVVILSVIVLAACKPTDEETSSTDTTATTGTTQTTETTEPLYPPAYLSYKDIVSRMYDLRALANPPLIGERSDQFSSYERNSRYSLALRMYHNWGANRDWEGYVRELGNNAYVMAEMEGPGYVTRIWTANASPDTRLRFYFDGETRPRMELSYRELFTRFGMNYDEIAYEAASGHNTYMPIPYNKSLRIETHNGGPGYHLLSYTTLPKNYTLEEFSYPLTESYQEALAEAQRFFKEDLGTNPTPHNEEETMTKQVTIPAGEAVDIFEETDPKAITSLRIKVNNLDLEGDEHWMALRELTLSAYWDGRDDASIWAPLGDFFGSGAGHQPFKSVPVGMLDDGWMYSNWYMPFEEARLVIGNDGTKDRVLDVELTTAPLEDSPEDLLRFNAKWSMMEDSRKNWERWPDSQALSTQGTGRFLGTVMHIYKPNSLYDPEGGGGYWWWGEGDEKFFIDGEAFPSWFGTGTEDYFGYAWGDATEFSKPFHAQPHTKGGMFAEGNRVNSRFHIIDNIPFHESFDAYFEKYYRDAYARQAVLTYWYLDKESSHDYGPVSLEERTGYYNYQPHALTYYNGEDVYMKSITGTFDIQREGDAITETDVWRNKHQLYWRAPNGGVLEFYIVAEEAGDYDLSVSLTKARDYGRVQFAVNGQNVGSVIDAYSENLAMTGETALGTVTLDEGLNVVKLTVVGKHLLSANYFVGLDYLKVTKK